MRSALTKVRDIDQRIILVEWLGGDLSESLGKKLPKTVSLPPDVWVYTTSELPV